MMILRVLKHFVLLISLRLMNRIINAAARGVLPAGASYQLKLEPTQNSPTSSHGLTGSPGMIKADNLEWFRVGKMNNEEVEIRSEIFDWNELPAIPEKIYKFKNPGYWWEA